jgi:HK97 family phage prohead protease
MLERKALEIEIKAEAEGRIVGYGSVFGNVDSYGDVIERGAFVDSLRRRPKIAMLWQHDQASPIGVWNEVREDDQGLVVNGALVMGTEKAREAYELVKAGAISGLSIGYRVKRDSLSGNTRVIKEVDLYEVSLVTLPANEAATITGFKSLSAADAPEVERVIRRAVGLSKSQARAFMAKGYAGLVEADEIDAAQVEAAKELAGLLKAIRA